MSANEAQQPIDDIGRTNIALHRLGRLYEAMIQRALEDEQKTANSNEKALSTSLAANERACDKVSPDAG